MPSEHFTPRFIETIVAYAAVTEAHVDTDPTSESYGHFIVTYQNGTVQDFGPITAYRAALDAGYVGTEQDWLADMFNIKAWAVGKKNDGNGNLVDVVSGDTGYHDNAKYYKELAETAKNNAVTAKNQAVAAQTASETARDQAVTAKTAAETAKNKAQAAQTAAETAQGRAEAARTAAETAQGAAENSALLSEGWAVGTQNGSPATSGQNFYQNNSKHWANIASAAKTNAEAARDSSTQQALKSEGYAVGKQNGTAAQSGEAYFEDNAKYYKEQAALSNAGAVQAKAATEAARDASQAQALVSEGWAVGSQNGTQVDSSSPYYHNNASYWANQASQSYQSLVALTVDALTGNPDSPASVTHTIVNGHDHFQFTIPKGDPFTIYGTYPSITAMNQDAANVPLHSFVMIAANPADVDNGKLYYREGNGFTYIADLSSPDFSVATTSEIDALFNS